MLDKESLKKISKACGQNDAKALGEVLADMGDGGFGAFEEEVFSSLRECLFCSRIELATMLVEAGCDIKKTRIWGDPLLVDMAHEHCQAGLAFLLKAGVEPDVRRRGGWTAAMVAAKTGKVEMLKELLVAGADIGLVDPHGKSLMDLAIHWESSCRESSPGSHHERRASECVALIQTVEAGRRLSQEVAPAARIAPKAKV
jgi:hypothetical protein